MVTAALTFGILCLFAVVIGAVAEQRIRPGFDDDLRATAADLAGPARQLARSTRTAEVTVRPSRCLAPGAGRRRGAGASSRTGR